MITINWEFNSTTELNRILYTLGGISRGFYEKNGFVILPYPTKLKNPAIVIFPNASLSKIQNIWNTAKNYNSATVRPYSGKKIEDDLLELLKEKHLLNEPEHKILRVDLEQKVELLSKENILENVLDVKIKDITIYPTKFGTITSSNRIRDGRIEIFAREDAQTEDILLSVVNSITRDKLIKQYKANWSEAQIVSDYILKETAINKVISKKYSTALGKTKEPIINKEILKLQEQLLNKIGYKQPDKKLQIKNDQILFGSSLVRGLTYYEQYALAEMIKNTGQVVTHDQIFEMLCINSPEFSLYATNKAVQRLRDKLVANNVPKNTIRTIRSRGYLLH